MSHQLNSPYDNDLDAFLIYDQSEQTQMSSTSDVKPVPALPHYASSVFTSNSDAFSGPSYQYDSHRQQTGLPMGGYQNTLAVNQASGLHYRPSNHGFVIPTETLNIPLSNLDDFDFNRPQAYEFPDMEMEGDAGPSMYFGGDAQNSASPANPTPPRIYPGMHTQKANEARLQQAQTQHQKQLPVGQQPLPSTIATVAPKSPAIKDPHVEESISRLLSRMRQSSNASADDDEDSPGGSSNLPRFKKDEDDMDEDERLLNSEEGKKLSSKERRQLRNKVSARAFRSRRKEYIGQLENEVAQKAQEANELRVQNRQLMEENTRLTDLTRMLLSSQSFSGFLQELSQTGNVSNFAQPQSTRAQKQPQQQQPIQQQPQPQPQPSRKDVSTHEASRQIQSKGNHMQVGMTLVPETPIDMSIFDGHTTWNHVPSSDFQVYALTEMPEPPKLDFASLSGKSDVPAMFAKTTPSSKGLPVLSSVLSLPNASQTLAVSVSQSDDLYDIPETSPFVQLALPTVLQTTLSKAAMSADILASRTTISGSWSELEQMCDELNSTCDRLSDLMSC